MKNFYIVSLCIIIIVSCTNKNENYTDHKNMRLVKCIDTITVMNSLFSIKKIELKFIKSPIAMDQIWGLCTVDNEGNIYLVGGNHEIYKFDSDGYFIRNFNNIGRGPGEYVNIAALTTDKTGNIYIDNSLQGLIQIYDKNFNFISSFKKKNPISVADLKVDDQGNLLCFNPIKGDNSIQVYNSLSGTLINEIGRHDDLSRKYNSNTISGNIEFDRGKILYVLPHIYQVYQINDGVEKELISQTPAHFKEIDFRVKRLSIDSQKYSVILKFFKEDELIFIITIPPRKFTEYKSGYNLPTDIINHHGTILREKVYFKDIWFINKYASGKYISIGYDKNIKNPNDIKSTNPYVLLFDYKF